MSTQRCMSFVVWIATLTLAVGATTSGAEPTAKHALLVGCTQYPLVDRIPELYGPANDIPLWRKLLTTPSPAGFGFPEQQVQQLLGWPDDVRQRPTRANIVAAFESLIAQAQPGVQIMIVLTGHGTQQPIPAGQDPFDSHNPEPDGLDEVFLPADSQEGSPAIVNGIVDNEIGAWLDQMRARGADVWIVFDCCHAGTMTRAVDDVERSRHVAATELGITREQHDAAVLRADAAVKQRRAQGLPIDAAKIPAKKSLGSLAAFYAAQPFERAPELPLPEDVPHVRENYYGLLSYTLVQTLLERHSPLSYRELSRVLAASYRARRGTRFPTPFAEGDLDREVLGAQQWPLQADWLIETQDDQLTVNAGELHGLTVDSVLAVHPPINDPRDAKTVLGYVKAVSVLPTTAVVAPLAYQGQPAITQVAPLSRCKIASRNFGEMRVKIFASPDPRLQAALEHLDKEVREMVVVTPREAEAQWRLLLVTPELARDFALDDATHDRVLLLSGEGRSSTIEARSAPRRYFASYALGDEKTLLGEWERDLPKLFRWQNLWRVSGGVKTLDGGETHGLILETFKLKNRQDTTGEPLRDGLLRSGDFVKFALKNDGTQNVWVSLLYLDAKLGVNHLYTGQIRAGDQLKPFSYRMKADASSAGQEGMIVLVTPVVDKTQPDFSFLAQEPLSVFEDRTRGIGDVPATPFGKLLKAATFNAGTRSMEPVVSTTPAIVTQSWLLLP